ncbi:MAG: hypothetical protein A2W91_03205 [Bacteroidetes bacterium GWF2_38_335]|nr:MAG: hypothetical protein A2W91_03205 [Bacteroidetes bacterium GWF2_38_335]OFY77502.1 MAG: hypothetical protein A2281_01555 [Bacteroidetes bacterium RIFOXYA12_FULL_38_20]HBS87202.1 hypothetical protein [Bacteroidales bacterium]
MKIVFSLYLISSLVFFACSDGNNDSEQGKTSSSESNVTDSNDYMVFTVPSPIIVSSMLKSLDLEFNESLIEDNINRGITCNRSMSKALNLGICLVDLSYASLFNQTQASLKLYKKVNEYTKMLGIESQEILDLTKKLESNVSNPDSLIKVLSEMQSKIDKYFLNREEQELALLILAGIFTEGLHISLNYISELEDNGNLIKYKENLDQMLLQQKVHLKNLNDLLSVYNKSVDYENLRNIFGELEDVFNDLAFNYSMSEDRKKIDRIYFKRKNLFLLLKKNSTVREKMLSAE